MTNSENAIKKTAIELNCSTKDVEKAIRIHGVYSKHKGAEKTARKKEQRQMMENLKLKQRMDAHPEICFCEELGIDVERRIDDTPIRWEKESHRIHGLLAKPSEIPVYRCSHCDKEWTQNIAMA